MHYCRPLIPPPAPSCNLNMVSSGLKNSSCRHLVNQTPGFQNDSTGGLKLDISTPIFITWAHDCPKYTVLAKSLLKGRLQREKKEMQVQRLSLK